MKDLSIRALLAAVLIAMGACGSPEEAPAAQSQGNDVSEEAVADASASAQPDDDPVIYPTVSRTRTGNGGIIALAGESTFEFDYASSQGRCEAETGRFQAKGVDPEDASRRVSIDYADIVDPNSGRSVGEAFQLEVRIRDDEVWAAYVGSGLAGKIENISQSESPGGGTVLAVTGITSAFRNNGAMIGRKAPFSLEATCE